MAEDKATSTMPDQIMNAGTGFFKVWSNLAAGKIAKAESRLQQTLRIIEAKETRDAAFRNEQKYRQRNGRLLSSMMTGIAKSGVRFEGSAAMALAESAVNAEKNVLEARFNALDAAQKTEFEGTMARNRGRSAQGAARIRAFGSVLESGSKAMGIAGGGA